MKPPSSDAESLRAQQPAPVRAPNGLFVTTNVLRHFASRQQTVGQTIHVLRWLVSELIVDPNGFRIRVRVPHGLLRGSAPIGIDRPTPAKTTISELGRRTMNGEDADVVGETSREAPRE
jgi:hypothetical protein